MERRPTIGKHSRHENKRPDVLTYCPRIHGRTLVRDVTMVDTAALIYLKFGSEFGSWWRRGGPC